MTAQEMFKELGYEEQFKGSDIYINRKDGSRIAFDDYNGGTIDVVELSYIPRELLKAINMRCQELGWIEEEKQEIKQETNFEHYKDEILNIFIDDLAMYGKELCKCDEVDCSVCSFNNGRGSCQQSRNKWLNQPYEKPVYKLTKFEFDLLQINSIKAFRFKNINALTLMKEKGYFKDVDEDATIEEILDNCEVTK